MVQMGKADHTRKERKEMMGSRGGKEVYVHLRNALDSLLEYTLCALLQIQL